MVQLDNVPKDPHVNGIAENFLYHVSILNKAQILQDQESMNQLSLAATTIPADHLKAYKDILWHANLRQKLYDLCLAFPSLRRLFVATHMKMMSQSRCLGVGDSHNGLNTSTNFEF